MEHKKPKHNRTEVIGGFIQFIRQSYVDMYGMKAYQRWEKENKRLLEKRVKKRLEDLR